MTLTPSKPAAAKASSSFARHLSTRIHMVGRNSLRRSFCERESAALARVWVSVSRLLAFCQSLGTGNICGVLDFKFTFCLLIAILLSYDNSFRTSLTSLGSFGAN